MAKYVYMFAEGNGTMRDLLGGKGANLAEMTNLGLPVPPGFIVTSEACNLFNMTGHVLSKEIEDEVLKAMAALEKETGKKFGDDENPLLVSVRSGARVSMPGMMDTVLNLGINDTAVKAIAKSTDNPRFAYDSYRRFIQMFANVVMDVDMNLFDESLENMKKEKGYETDLDLTVEDLKELTETFKAIYKKELGEDFPMDAKNQLYRAISAVFNSWNNPRAFKYRQMNNIPYGWGTAVNVQVMVFGNMGGDDSGTGVVFTRHPSTGANEIFGEYMENAQGEDIVAGIRTPKPFESFRESNPNLYAELREIATLLERHYKDMQDIEITIEEGKLYILQTRTAKRTAQAALKIAIDMHYEGITTKEEALLQIDATYLDQLLHPTFDRDVINGAVELGRGLPASPGAVVGKVYFTSDVAKQAARDGEDVILVRHETSPDDIEGMYLAKGILTSRGGMTSHAALVARGIGRCCVAGMEELRVDEKNKQFRIGDVVVNEGEVISLDGSDGRIYLGAIPIREAELTGDFNTIMAWADELKRMEVRTNVDTAIDAKKAFDNGAEGIGLVRTEHMFFDKERIVAIQEMILADNTKDRKKALETLLPFQRNDFIEIFRVSKDLPVTIRLLDPPLHEFMPSSEEEFENLVAATGKTVEELKSLANDLYEINPMLGHRGCRIAVTYPELVEMQTTAIIEAAIQVVKETEHHVKPEIMIPLVGDYKEFEYIKDIIKPLADELIKNAGIELDYMIGTMIEVPRACLTADKIAMEAEFFSFGTNDLTQMTYGMSRDDAGKFLNEYFDKLIFEADPTAILDQEAVGELMKIAIKKGRKTRPDIKLGICGEHGGEPSSIEFCHNIGLDYVSCSPFRVPIAKLASAQSAIKNK